MISIALLRDRPELSVDGAPFTLRAPPKTASLLSYLLLFRRERVRRDALAAALWPDTRESIARENLRRHLHYFDHAIPSTLGSWIARDGATLSFDPQCGFDLDLDLFESAKDDVASLSQAVAAYRADLLQAYEDEWLLPERERLRQRHIAYLERLAILHRRDGDVAQSIDSLRALLLADPLREDAVRTIMRLRTDAGDRAGALAEYSRFAEQLRDEIGAAPMNETIALRDAIARSDRLAEPHTVRLPFAATSFVGRAEEIARIDGLLHDARLVTLVGPPGVGKTRLAVEVARKAADRFSDGALFVHLGEVDDATVDSALCNALQRARALDPKLPYLEQLAGLRLLLVLDNCEHVAHTAAKAIDDIMHQTECVSVIATSRHVLDVDCETTVAVEPLAEAEAVRMFCERARAARFALRPVLIPSETASSLCRALGGLPLAIEIAAARLRTLSLKEVEKTARESVAVNGDTGASVPQRSLNNEFKRSYDLLDEREQRCFRRLSIFRGSFDALAAASVCEIRDNGEMTDVLVHLCSKSLVVAPRIDADRQRWSLLVPIREFSRGLLEREGEKPDVLRLHAAHFAQVAGKHPSADALLSDTPDLKAALTFSLEWEGNRGVGVELACTLGSLWMSRGPFGELARLLEVALAQPAIRREQRALLTATLGVVQRNAGDLFRSLKTSQDAVEQWRLLDSPSGLCDALNALAQTQLMSGDRERAEPHAYEALEIAKKTGDPDRTLRSLHIVYLLALAVRRIDEARTVAQAILEIATALGAEDRIAIAHSQLGTCAYYSGDLAQAAALDRRALRAARKAGLDSTTAFVLHQFAPKEWLLGHRASAKKLLAEAFDLAYATAYTGIALHAFEMLAHFLVDDGRAFEAATFSAVAHQGYERCLLPHQPVQMRDHDRLMNKLDAALQTDARERAEMIGKRLSLFEAVEQARAALTRHPRPISP